MRGSVLPINTCIQTALRCIELRSCVNTIKSKLSGNNKSIITDRIAKRLCMTGITFEMLKCFLLLSEVRNKLPRVTNRKILINVINNFFRDNSAIALVWKLCISYVEIMKLSFEITIRCSHIYRFVNVNSLYKNIYIW